MIAVVYVMIIVKHLFVANEIAASSRPNCRNVYFFFFKSSVFHKKKNQIYRTYLMEKKKLLNYKMPQNEDNIT